MGGRKGHTMITLIFLAICSTVIFPAVLLDSFFQSSKLFWVNPSYMDRPLMKFCLVAFKMFLISYSDIRLFRPITLHQILFQYLKFALRHGRDCFKKYLLTV